MPDGIDSPDVSHETIIKPAWIVAQESKISKDSLRTALGQIGVGGNISEADKAQPAVNQGSIVATPEGDAHIYDKWKRKGKK